MPLQPRINFSNDRSDRIMARAGAVIGFSKYQVVWRFGMLPESDAAEAYGVSTDNFTFILSDWLGHEIERFEGFAFDLPEKFWRVINAKFSSPNSR